MNIVKKHGFRSEGRGINKSDDMYRVMIDMSKHEYLLIEQWMARQDKGSHQAQTTNSVSPKCGECGSDTITITCGKCHQVRQFGTWSSPHIGR